ncbi:DNA-binding transcriptional LysR family regulator [Streptomyces griseochromogenes]|uniref:DNA-binding transcriptional LysR family regulator n=1 Tax=Streptomyces griseochromogenes TaxID=68214 RepID=A0A1B1AUZ0_9ACTN|nr:LysR family transcriptional regulator [Streptomyces griseochromogenes]ANP50386.1 LysR family transcriptional regulator [Streptomyces griseochromogenes]MBP2047922.1 DNA-binding transcriptional LysR family regulator [Streptomyces griseochromogenes]
MELRQLTYFVAVAEELHFGRAAERLHIVQSAVSQQIQRLERELRAELFDRSPRRVRLTPAGERLLPEARAVLAAARRARAAVAEPAGLRIGTSTGLGAHLDRVLAAFAERAPDVPVELVSLPVTERLARVAAGGLDAAFVRSAEPPPGVRVLPLWPDPLVAALPAAHPLAGRPDIDLADLAGLPLALTSRRNNPALVDLVVGACHAAGFEPLTGPVGGSLQDTLATIGSRPLWTVVYASHARVLHTPRVSYVPFRAPGLALSTGLAVSTAAPTPHLEKLLLACNDHEH